MTNRKYYDLVKVGSNLKSARKNRQTSVEQVREYLGLECTQSIYKWERGDCLPQADTLIALCVYYGVNPLTIFGESPSDETELGQDVNSEKFHLGTDILTEPVSIHHDCSIFLINSNSLALSANL